MQKGCTVRPYRPGDEDCIASLLESIYGISMNREEWKWKYTRAPAGDSIIVVAVSDGRIVGHVACIPCRVAVDGSPIAAFTGVDAMVSADQRGKGVFNDMEICLNEHFRASGAKLLFSFANPASGGILTSRGIRDRICDVESLTRIIRPFTALVNRVRVRAVRGAGSGSSSGTFELPPFPTAVIGSVRLDETDEFGPEMDTFWHAACSLHRVSVWRDAAYLTWRYLEHPTRSYRVIIVRIDGEVAGYFVLGTLDVGFRKGFLVDLVLGEEQDHVIDTVTGRVTDYFRKAGIESVTTWLPGRSVPFDRLRHNGFSRRDAEVTVIGTCLDRNLDFFLDGKNWYYSAGDTDVV